MKEYIVQAIESETIESFDARNTPELIRCRECKHSKSYSDGEFYGCTFMDGLKPGDWYCADGKREDSE